MQLNGPLMITVNHRHMAEGKRNTVASCPVALAIREALSERLARCGITFEIHVVVTPTTLVAYWMWWPYHAIPTPPEVGTWIKRFDAGADVAPLNFVVDSQTWLSGLAEDLHRMAQTVDRLRSQPDEIVIAG